MIRDVVTRGYSGQGDGLKYVVTRGYDLGAVAVASGSVIADVVNFTHTATDTLDFTHTATDVIPFTHEAADAIDFAG